MGWKGDTTRCVFDSSGYFFWREGYGPLSAGAVGGLLFLYDGTAAMGIFSAPTPKSTCTTCVCSTRRVGVEGSTASECLRRRHSRRCRRKLTMLWLRNPSVPARQRIHAKERIARMVERRQKLATYVTTPQPRSPFIVPTGLNLDTFLRTTFSKCKKCNSRKDISVMASASHW